MQQHNMATKRSDYIDVYKGIAIMCITLLHYEDGIFPTWLSVFIGSFMIAAFYLTSGWLMGLKDKHITTKELARKRLKSLGVPYLWFSIIFLVFDFVLYIFNYYDISYLGKEVYKTLTLRGIGTLWFLPALFFAEIIIYFIIRKKIWVQIAVILLALAYMEVYGYWSSNYRNLSSTMQLIDAPFRTINNAMFASIVLFYSCYAAKWYKAKIKSTKRLLKIILMIAMLGFYFWFSFNPVDIPVFQTILVLPALLFGMFIFSYFISKVPLLNNFFVFWGKNSLIMMVTHYSIIQVLCEIINKYWLHNDAFTGYITLVFFVVTVLIEYPIVWFMNKYCQRILGKN